MRERKVVVVTGASAGIGRATVRAFAQRGYDVGLLARGIDGLEGARREVEAAGQRALVLPTDVADAAAIERAAAAVESELGPIDVWVNNAMVSVFSPVTEMTPEEFRRVTEVTYLGYVWGTMAALKRMKPRDRGVIIQVGSALAYRAIPLQSAYCAAKHAIKGFTESLRCELLHDGSKIELSMVHMPAVNTPQFDWVRSRLPNRAQPVPPIYQPEVAAHAILHTARNPRREVWVGGPTVKAIVGERVVPNYIDHKLAREGYDAQQTDEEAPVVRLDNLWAPLPGDRGAHGRFDDRSRQASAELWAANHKGLIATALASLSAIALGFRAAAKMRLLPSL